MVGIITTGSCDTAAVSVSRSHMSMANLLTTASDCFTARIRCWDATDCYWRCATDDLYRFSAASDDGCICICYKYGCDEGKDAQNNKILHRMFLSGKRV